MRFTLPLLALLAIATVAHAGATGPQRVPALVTGACAGDTINVSAELWPGRL